MKNVNLKNFVIALVSLLSLLIAGCGGSGGVNSPDASLGIQIDKSSISSGDVVVITATLTSKSGSSVNGVKVRIMSTDSKVMASGEGYTNSSGVANIILTAKWVAKDTSISLQAGSDGITPSSSLPITVVAPKLTATIPATSTYAVKAGTPGSIVRVVMQGTTAKFLNGNSNPIVNQPVDFTITSITNQTNGDIAVFFPSPGLTINSPTGILTVVTDNAGLANIPMAVDVVVPAYDGQHVITLNWQATADYAGNSYVVTGSSQFTITNSKPS